MYTSHFGLTAEPFSLTPDPEFLYLSTGHAEALAALKVGLLGKRGLMVMTGEVGTGKTTLLYALLRALGEGVRTAYVSNTALGFDGLLRLALVDFAVTPASSARVDMLTALNQLLRDCAERDVTATLIVDEAQNLDAEAFEQLRLLTNFETFTHKLLQVVLVGQPELQARLRDPALRALVERIAVHCRLEPLGERESRAYVDYRLLRAGGSTRLFERNAREHLLAAAEGLPRRINILCHNALLFAYGRGASRVTLPMAELAVAGRAALLRDGSAPEPAPRVELPSRRRSPRLALALGAAALLAALAIAGWRVAARQTPHPGAPSAPEDVETRPSVAAPDQMRAAPAAVSDPAPAADAESDAAVAEAAPPDDRLASAPLHGAAVDATAQTGAAVGGTHIGSDEPARARQAAAPVDAVPDSHVDQPRFRTVRVAAGSTLESLAREVYGGVDPVLIKRIQSANPQVVNPNVIMTGDLLRFPEFAPGNR
jgi:general secretion pathway protein A